MVKKKAKGPKATKKQGTFIEQMFVYVLTMLIHVLNFAGWRQLCIICFQ